MAKMGRPKFEIDYALVADLAHIHCTQQEIASILGCAIRTLQNDAEFMRVYKNGLDGGRMSLRRAQMKKALSGNPTMLIWLGKQLLGQRDTPADDGDDMLGKVTEAIAKAVGE